MALGHQEGRNREQIVKIQKILSCGYNYMYEYLSNLIVVKWLS